MSASNKLKQKKDEEKNVSSLLTCNNVMKLNLSGCLFIHTYEHLRTIHSMIGLGAIIFKQHNEHLSIKFLFYVPAQQDLPGFSTTGLGCKLGVQLFHEPLGYI